MAKSIVIDPADGTRIPFLRGVLSRSLFEAGVPFKQAYKIATQLRNELEELGEITTHALRERVAERLRGGVPEEVVEAYLKAGGPADTIWVHDEEGQANPFSRFQHQRCLESCGLANDEAYTATRAVYEALIARGTHEIRSEELRRLTHHCLRTQLGEEQARRYQVWVEFSRSGRPLVLLIGGTTGCGKSTIATEVAHRLGIVRTQSTDMLREAMRMMVPERLLPALHTSSFSAWTTLPASQVVHEETEALIADGYLAQAELLAVPCEAVIQRALREGVSLILEGVHVHPLLLGRIGRESDAIVVPIMLSVRKEKRLRRRIRGRRKEAPLRAFEVQLEHFDAIWQLQSFLLSEADRAHVPIIDNSDKETTVKLVVDAIIDILSRHFGEGS